MGNSKDDIIGTNPDGTHRYRNGSNNKNGVRRNRNIVRGNNRITPTNNNPITRTFNAPQSPRYYKPNGQMIPVGYNLHQHQDGTIMSEHVMGRNDKSIIVTTTKPRNRVGNVNRRRTSRTRTNTMKNIPVKRTTANRVNRRPKRTGGTSY